MATDYKFDEAAGNPQPCSGPKDETCKGCPIYNSCSLVGYAMTKEEAEYENQCGNPDHGLMPWEIK